MTLVYLVAGEASGDALGARLMQSLRARQPDIRFAGIGGPQMRAQGLDSLFPMQDLALIGLVEILPKLRNLGLRMKQAVADIAACRPDVLVTIDSPGFTLRLLRRVAHLGINRVHYVAPQVWAWHESRVKTFPGLWDDLLCLLPFEPAFFAGHGVAAEFVGHPVLQYGADQGDAARFRAGHGVAPEAPVLVLMPGSRRTEVSRLLPVFGRTLDLLPGVVPVVVAAAEGVAPIVARAAAGWARRPIVVHSAQDKYDAFAAASAALTKSGTSTLELALAGVPMAVTYRVNPISAAIGRRVIKVRYAALVNLLADRAVVPELLQHDCRPDRLAAVVRGLLAQDVAALAQRAAFPAILRSLAPPEGLPSDAAAAAVLRLATG